MKVVPEYTFITGRRGIYFGWRGMWHQLRESRMIKGTPVFYHHIFISLEEERIAL